MREESVTRTLRPPASTTVTSARDIAGAPATASSAQANAMRNRRPFMFHLSLRQDQLAVRRDAQAVLLPLMLQDRFSCSAQELAHIEARRRFARLELRMRSGSF
jgi:hypothetical protein